MKKAKVFNKSLVVGSGLIARPGTVLTARRSYAWLTFAAQAQESVFRIEELGFSGFTPLVVNQIDNRLPGIVEVRCACCPLRPGIRGCA